MRDIKKENEAIRQAINNLDSVNTTDTSHILDYRKTGNELYIYGMWQFEGIWPVATNYTNKEYKLYMTKFHNRMKRLEQFIASTSGYCFA